MMHVQLTPTSSTVTVPDPFENVTLSQTLPPRGAGWEVARRCMAFPRLLWDTGMSCVVCSGLCFSVSSALLKYIGPALPVTEIILARSVISMTCAVVLSFARPAGAPPLFGRREQYGILLIRGILGATSQIAVYLAVLALPLADSTSILFLAPALTAALAWLVLGEPAGQHTLVGCTTCLLGVFIVAQPPFLVGMLTGRPVPWTRERLLGVGAALAGAFLTAGAYVVIRHVGKQTVPLTMSAWFFSVSFFTILPAVALSFPGPLLLPSPLQALTLVGIALTSFLAQLLMGRGLQLMPAAKCANVNLMQVVYASLLGLAFFDEAISWLQVLGAVFLAVGILEVNRQKISLLNVAASEGHAAIHDPEGQHLLGATSDQDEDGLPSKVVEGVHSLLLPLKHEPHSGQQGSPLH
uniref:EamA domain-containing protein n=1 Tax=Auxenochlorella protothecoides TaxID=3075 RepID=A0A1D2AFF9_AUXPR